LTEAGTWILEQRAFTSTGAGRGRLRSCSSGGGGGGAWPGWMVTRGDSMKLRWLST